MTKLQQHVVNRGINHCDLRLELMDGNLDSPEFEMYCTMGDTWVITIDTYGHFTLRQMTLEQAIAQIKRRIQAGWLIPSDAYPMAHIIRLFEIKKGWLPNE